MGGRLDPSVANVRRAVRAECADLDPGATVIVASSGGADSLVLAAAAHFEGSRAGWLVGAATVDHGLQEGSSDVAERAAAALRGLGCEPVHVLAVTVGDVGGPEAAARAARYDALEALASDTSATVLLGHTLDDQAETVLLGLARGSGLRSLAGMPRRRDPFRRPLLDVPRSTVLAAAEALGLDPWRDPHNDNRRFARARVRASALPSLERELGPGVAAALSRTARLARADADALDAWAEQAYDSARATPDALVVAALVDLPGAIRTRVLRLGALAAGSPSTDLTAGHIEALDALVDGWRGPRELSLPGRVCARRTRSAIRFEQAPAR